MSGTFPQSPAARRASLVSIHSTRLSVAHSLKVQARSTGPQRWLWRLQFAPMSRAEFAPLWAHIVAQGGQYDTFTWYAPSPYTVAQGAWGPTVITANSAEVGATSVALAGLTINRADAMKAGDLFKFAGHSKVYIVTADAASGAGGAGTLPFFPKLVTAVANGEGVTHAAVPYIVALGTDTPAFDLELAALHGFSIDLIERV